MNNQTDVFSIEVHCPNDRGIDGQHLVGIPFVPSVGARIKIGGDWKTVTAQQIELNNTGWDATARVSITVE